MVFKRATDHPPPIATRNHAARPFYAQESVVYTSRMSNCNEDYGCSAEDDCCSTTVGPAIQLLVSGSTTIEIIRTSSSITESASESSTVSTRTLVPPTTRASSDVENVATSTSSEDSWSQILTTFDTSTSSSQMTRVTEGLPSNTTYSQIIASDQSTVQSSPTPLTPNTLAQADSNDNLLSKGSLAGIVFGTALATVLVTLLVVFLIR